VPSRVVPSRVVAATVVHPARWTRRPGRPRAAYLDNLKVVLVVGVIVAHAFITYGDVGSWAYHEPSGNDAFLVVAALAVSLGSLFAMGLFFLIAGLLTPRTLARKGCGGFMRDRLVRLGVPFMAYLLLLYPFVNWLGDLGGASFGSILGEQAHRLDPGPLWFVAVLLVYSAGYAVVRTLHQAGERGHLSLPAFLGLLAAIVAAVTVIVRLWFPIDSYQVFALHLWHWPQCLGLFVLGVVCAERGWLDPVPDAVRRAGGVAAGGAAGLVVAAFALNSDDLDPFAGGWAWQAVLTAGCEAVIAVGLSVWLLGHFQRRHDHAGPLGKALGRAAFGSYVLQAPVLVAVAVSLRGLPLSPEVKFLVVAPVAVAGAFVASWVLTRTPGVRRVL